MSKINNQSVENFKEILDQEFETYSYSGQAMYGKKCLAFNISRESSDAGVVASIVADYVDEFGDGTVEDIVVFFERSKTDSMGLDTVMYFPSIVWQEEWDENENLLFGTHSFRDVG